MCARSQRATALRATFRPGGRDSIVTTYGRRSMSGDRSIRVGEIETGIGVAARPMRLCSQLGGAFFVADRTVLEAAKPACAQRRPSEATKAAASLSRRHIPADFAYFLGKTASCLNGALLAVVGLRQDSPRRLVFAPRTGSQARANRHEALLDVLGVFAVFVSVTIVPILALLGYSLKATPRQGRDYLRKREPLTEATVDATSTIAGRQAQSLPYTYLLFLSKALISPEFGTFCVERAGECCRSNLEQLTEFVKQWSANLIRPEEQTIGTIHAGEPT